MLQGANNSKIKAIQKQIDETKKIMESNIDKILIRDEKLQALQDKTQQIEIKAQLFNQQARQLQQVLRFKNVSQNMLLIGATLGTMVGIYCALTGSSGMMIPLCAAIGAGLFHLLNRPLEALFNIYQGMIFGRELHEKKRMLLDRVPTVAAQVMPEQIKSSQRSYLTRKVAPPVIATSEPPKTARKFRH